MRDGAGWKEFDSLAYALQKRYTHDFRVYFFVRPSRTNRMVLQNAAPCVFPCVSVCKKDTRVDFDAEGFVFTCVSVCILPVSIFFLPCVSFRVYPCVSVSNFCVYVCISVCIRVYLARVYLFFAVCIFPCVSSCVSHTTYLQLCLWLPDCLAAGRPAAGQLDRRLTDSPD